MPQPKYTDNSLAVSERSRENHAYSRGFDTHNTSLSALLRRGMEMEFTVAPQINARVAPSSISQSKLRKVIEDALGVLNADIAFDPSEKQA